MRFKKIILFFTVLFTVTSCRAKNDGKPTNWTKEELALMEKHWGKDVIIPFYYVEGYELTDYFNKGNSDLYVFAPNGTESMIDDYSKLLKKQNYTLEYDKDFHGYNGTKSLGNGNGLFLQYFILNGQWTIFAEVYEEVSTSSHFPQNDINNFLSSYGINETFPKLEGCKNYTWFEETSNDGKKYLHLWATNITDDIFFDWVSSLESSDYRVLKVQDNFDGYKRYSCISNGGFGRIKLDVQYYPNFSDPEVDIDIYPQDERTPLTSWPANQLNEFLGDVSRNIPIYPASEYYVSNLYDYDNVTLKGYSIEIKQNVATDGLRKTIQNTEIFYRTCLEEAGFYVDNSAHEDYVDYEMFDSYLGRQWYTAYDKDESILISFDYHKNIFEIRFEKKENNYEIMTQISELNNYINRNLNLENFELPNFKDADYYEASYYYYDSNVYARLVYKEPFYTMAELDSLFISSGFTVKKYFNDENVASKSDTTSIDIYYRVDTDKPIGFKQRVYLDIYI